MKKLKKLKPAIFSGPLGWGWVSLGDLAEIIGQSPKKTWDSFFGLTKDIQYEILAWSPDLEELVQDGTDPKDFSSVYVPAGWAQDVLRAHELGAVRVEVVYHEHKSHLDGCPDGALTCYYTGYEFASAVGIRADGTPVDYCERPAPKTEDACCHGCLEAGYILRGHSICVFPSEESLKALKEGRASLVLEQGRGWQVVYEISRFLQASVVGTTIEAHN